MGVGPAVAVADGAAAYTHLLDPRPWYKNNRTLASVYHRILCLLLIPGLLLLNFWIAVMYV